MFEYLYTHPIRSDESIRQSRWMPLPDGKTRDRLRKYPILEVADGIKSFFENHLKRDVNVSVLGDRDFYILVSMSHFVFVISQLLKCTSGLECPHLNIEIKQKFKIIITFNYELPIPKNILDILITAEHSGFSMHIENSSLVFEAKLRRPKIITLYQPSSTGFREEFERCMLWELKHK